MNDILNAGIGGIIFIILIIIVIWFIVRELRCWYWKVNKQVETLESINQRLLDIQRLLVQGNTVNATMTGEISNIASDITSNMAAQRTIGDEEELPEL